MAKQRREALDNIDAENVKEMLGSNGWQLFSERIAAELLRKRSQLEDTRPEAETANLRGFIGGLKLALEVPQILINEGKQKQREDA